MIKSLLLLVFQVYLSFTKIWGTYYFQTNKFIIIVPKQYQVNNNLLATNPLFGSMVCHLLSVYYNINIVEVFSSSCSHTKLII